MILPKSITIFFQSILYLFTLVLFKTFCKFEVRGLENVMNLEPGIIFAANHTSEWDPLLVGIALPYFKKNFLPIYYVSRTSEFYNSSGWRGIFYGGFIFKLFGAYPAYSGKKDYAHSLQHFVSFLKLKRNVCIFPEGKRSRTGEIGEAHGGLGYLAYTTGAPVVPVAIRGVYNLSLREFFTKRPRVGVEFFEVIFGYEQNLQTPSAYKFFSEKALCVIERNF